MSPTDRKKYTQLSKGILKIVRKYKSKDTRLYKSIEMRLARIEAQVINIVHPSKKRSVPIEPSAVDLELRLLSDDVSEIGLKITSLDFKSLANLLYDLGQFVTKLLPGEK